MAWKYNEVSSTSYEEQENMILMASRHSDDEENKVGDLEPSYDELHNAFL